MLPFYFFICEKEITDHRAFKYFPVLWKSLEYFTSVEKNLVASLTILGNFNVIFAKSSRVKKAKELKTKKKEFQRHTAQKKPYISGTSIVVFLQPDQFVHPTSPHNLRSIQLKNNIPQPELAHFSRLALGISSPFFSYSSRHFLQKSSLLRPIDLSASLGDTKTKKHYFKGLFSPSPSPPPLLPLPLSPSPSPPPLLPLSFSPLLLPLPFSPSPSPLSFSPSPYLT